jgi:cellulose synthase/poly-beta-1,6-N-acetylglucosamine synthase-like glycosyltransferase
MVTLFVILLILSFIYLFITIFITLGLFKIPSNTRDNKPTVSVIVAARNEEKNIKQLLNALAAQDYPQDKFSIFLVDDMSTDKTFQIVSEYQKSFPNLDLNLHVAENRDSITSPKKNALALGIRKSKGDILLFTDADCKPPKAWVTGIVETFTQNVGMVIGYSPYEIPSPKSLTSKLIGLDAMALAALAAGTSGWGRPATCNGRNLAYKRDVYEKLNGFSGIDQFVSGDDDLFLKKVLQNKIKVRYACAPHLVVPTKLLTGWKQFINQRLRHASKGFHYSPKQVTSLTLLYLYYLLLLICIPIGFIYGFWQLALSALLVKSIGEFILLFFFAFFIKRQYLMTVFPLAVLLYIPYVVVFGLLGQFLSFEWKGEKTSAKNADGVKVEN